MKARDLLRAVEQYELSKKMLMELPDDKLHQAILISAGLFKKLKEEAIRRKIWDRLKGEKVT